MLTLKELDTIYNSLSALPQEQRLAAVTTQRDTPWGNTILHTASTDPIMFQKILDLLPKDLSPDARFAMATTTNNRGQTVLHTAFKSPESFQALLYFLPPEKRFDAVMAKDKYGTIVLHEPCKKLALFDSIINSLPETQRFDAVTTRDRNGDTVLHKLDQSPELLQNILNLLPKDKLIAALTAPGHHGDTVLHKVSQYPTESLKQILTSLPEDKRIEVLLVQNNYMESILNRCLKYGRLQEIIDSLPKSNPPYPPEVSQALLLKLNELISTQEAPSAVQNADLKQQIACLTKIFQGKKLDDAEMGFLKTDPAIKEIFETHLSQEVTSTQKDWRGEIKNLREGEQPSPPIEPPKI